MNRNPGCYPDFFLKYLSMTFIISTNLSPRVKGLQRWVNVILLG